MTDVFVTSGIQDFTWSWAHKPYAIRATGQYAIFFYLSDHTALDGTALLATAPLHISWMQALFDGKRLERKDIIPDVVGG